MATETQTLTRKDFQSDQDVRWCPGCGDYAILSAVQSVFPELGIPKENFVIISGIGCSSRFPYYMDTYGMHTIHGRAPAIATGITFVIASIMGRRMSDSVGQALGSVVTLGIIGLVIAMVVQLIGGIFAPQMFLGGGFELMIAGFGTVLFIGAAFLDFYTMPRVYQDEQYLAGALSMYLTYINLFIFILRFIIAIQSRD